MLSRRGGDARDKGDGLYVIVLVSSDLGGGSRVESPKLLEKKVRVV